MIVMKFGGSSVASVENIRKVKAILDQKEQHFLVVVSAFSGTTDKLQTIAQKSLIKEHTSLVDELKEHHSHIAKALVPLAHQADVLIYIQKQFNQLELLCNGIAALQELSDRTLAKIMGMGEILSSYIIRQYLHFEANFDIELLDSRTYIQTSGNYLKGDLNSTLTEAKISTINQSKNYIVPGFISSNAANELVLLGRGGSDYSAAIFSAYLNAEYLEIWSDVDGMLNANPKLVKTAKSIQELSYKEAFELSHFGAKVLYAPTIRPVMKKAIPVYLKNTFNPSNAGTFIGNLDEKEQEAVKGISSINGLSIITVSGVGIAGIKGTARRVFKALEDANVNVVLITQCCSEQNICIGVLEQNEQEAIDSLETEFDREIAKSLIDPINVQNDYAVIALVGDNMKMKVGLSGKVFSALGENGVNIIAIAQGASERNISLVVSKKDEKKAINVLHERFFEDANKKIHLFVAGIGNVGAKFLKIIQDRKDHLLKEYKIDIKLIGIANSKKMLIQEEGLDKINIQDGRPYGQFEDFVQAMIKLNLRNSIFIDNTASDIVSDQYASILEKSISVICCNKIACSSSYRNYIQLKQLAKNHNCHFNYETTVGAALPVIKTVEGLVLSGDKINKIQAVLSGSLNFIFNNYDGEKSFASIVRQAMEEGYTEPNPLIDLSGKDVMRKILILARESGYPIEFEEVKAIPFLPQDCLNAKSVDVLFENMTKAEATFKKIYDQANSKGNKLKVVATFQDGQASVGLEEVAPSSPFYHLEGKDNIVSLQTERYPVEPLVIKGAGAGAELTASGVFSDLMLIVNRL